MIFYTILIFRDIAFVVQLCAVTFYLIYQELQKEKMSPKNASAQKSLAASSPTSGKATSNFTLGSPAPYKKGRFSVSRITPPLPIAEEEDAVAESINKEEKGGAKMTTRKSSHMNQDDKTSLMATPEQLTRSTQPILKVTPMRRRSGAVAVIKAKRRSGASSANLLGWFQQLNFNMIFNPLKCGDKSEISLFQYVEATK